MDYGAYVRGLSLASLALWTPVLLIAHPTPQDRLHAVDHRIAADPGNPVLYLRRAEVLQEARDWGAALTDYGRASELGADPLAVGLGRGELLIAAGRVVEAVEVLDRVLAVAASEPTALRLRGRALALLGQPSSAANDLRHAIAVIERPSPDLYLELARNLAASGRHGEALEGIDAAIDRIGPLSSLLLEAVDLELARGRHPAALQRLESYASASRVGERFRVVEGELLERLGRRAEARQAFLSALETIATRSARARAGALAPLADRARQGIERLASGIDKQPGPDAVALREEE